VKKKLSTLHKNMCRNLLGNRQQTGMVLLDTF